ncbi:glycosyltransferase [Niveispirillum fermenti]|uniref:glycosyltransferase n=1 Tax=Niveispirillum fermenti TaxID=1233113 RepID=UPI00404333D9
MTAADLFGSPRLALRARLLAGIKAGAGAGLDLLAERLLRMEPVHADDLLVVATVQFVQGKVETARSLLDCALSLSPRHLMVACTLARLGVLTPDVVAALAWHAETSDQAHEMLLAHVAATGRPACFIRQRQLHCAVAPGGRQLRMTWQHLVVRQDDLPASDKVQSWPLPLPEALLGPVDPVVAVDGVPVQSGLAAGRWLRPPRLSGLVEITDDGHYQARVLDMACPERPVAVLIMEGDRVVGRHVSVPPDGAVMLDVLDAPILSFQLPAGAGRVRLLFELTGEPLSLPPATPRAGAAEDGTVDVIVPVHGDRAATQACFDALLGCDPGWPMRIVAIDDRGPDPEIGQFLDDLARQGRIVLRRNPGNLGFVRSVNIGMALHPDRDVVLLNADTCVSAGWLGRLRAAALGSDRTGTATPWSNDATICSYPLANAPTPLADIDVEELDDVARTALAGRTMEVPTGVGFCLYIRRACLDQTGWFDAEAFGAGYGEENDFCLRATAQGWRHVIALDTFVGHVGGGSFGAAKQARINAALAVLATRYPDYEAEVHRFIAADPLGPARRLLDRARLLADGVPRPVLLVCAELGGGTERFLRERIAMLAAPVLLLRPVGGGRDGCVRLCLEVPDRLELNNLSYGDDGDGLAALHEDLIRFGVREMELHHPRLLRVGLLQELATWFPYRAHIHDYSWICPRITLTADKDRYCGEPPVDRCEICVGRFGDELGIGDMAVVEWRQAMASVLAGAGQVGCSTRDTAVRMHRYIPAARYEVAPAEKPALPPAPVLPTRRARGEGVRIVVPGAIGPPKGYQLLLDCARDARQRGLPLTFQILGYSLDDEELCQTGHIVVTGRYAEAEVPSLLALLRPHLAFLPSTWPETWCYALTHVMSAGLPVVAFDLGAQAERLRAWGRGALLPPALPPAAINDALLSLVVEG